MPEPITPADLARDLGVDVKRIRKFLRAEFGKLSPPGRWELDEEKVATTIAHFRAKL